MKTLTSLICGLILLGAAPFAFTAPESSRSKEPAPPTVPQWNVHGEVLMVAMPQDKLLTILPDLRDSQKIDAAVAQLLIAIKQKEAVLMGYPIIETHDGLRAVTETILEKRYPTEFDPPYQEQTITTGIQPSTKSINDVALPTSFETRNTGVTLELEPTVTNKGDSIHFNIAVSRTELMGFDSYEGARLASGQVIKIDQPQFFDTKIQSQFTVRNGQHLLIGVHKLLKPENYMEIFIFQGSAAPIK